MIEFDNYTNKYKLEQRTIGLLSRTRKPEVNVFHVTSLIDVPRPRTLLLEKWEKLELDYSDELSTLGGNAVHAYAAGVSRAEMADDERLACEFTVNGVDCVVTGQPDSYDNGVLSDIKRVNVTKMQFYREDTLKKYEQQTNIYAHMLRKEGHEVSKIVIDVYYDGWRLAEYLRNRECWALIKPGGKRATKIYWSEEEAVDNLINYPGCEIQYRESKGYPQIPVEYIDIPVWEDGKVEEFIRERLTYHLSKPYDCPVEEHWRDECRCQSYCHSRSVCDYAKELRNV